MSGTRYDLAVIGGGINGCGIARDAAGRGLTVFLCEQGDLAGATSSASTKLIHGGLRYLEYYEFRLVREALIEREVLLRAAPHIVRPLRFVLPYHKGLRPWPIVRLGLFLYDHLGGRRLLPPTRTLDLTTDSAGDILRPSYRRAFEYSDCWVEDARLVVLNARDAANRGADIRTRTKCIAAGREDGRWRLTLEDQRTGERQRVAATALVNASGPWASSTITAVAGLNAPAPVRLVKGSHIVVKRLFDHDRAYIFQNTDGRVCFAIPFEGEWTLIGTTDEDYSGDPGSVAISDTETDYLLSSVSEYLRTPVERADVRWSYAGVRPLYDDGASKAQEATRDYVLSLDGSGATPPLLSVIGGKITTYRRLAEAALAALKQTFPAMAKPWTADVPLPGGEIAADGIEDWIAARAQDYPFLDARTLRRLCRAYGARIDTLMAGAKNLADLGRQFGGGLSEREIDYLVREEWAETAEDILWRRSKLGLHMSPDEQAGVHQFMAATATTPVAAARGAP
jgi:glycerol-3-phosphate dehydrogenase